MKRTLSLLLMLCLLLSAAPLALLGCTQERIVNFLNWGDYLDKDLKEEFKKRTGLTIRETIVNSNEDMIEKLMQEDCPYDLCTPSDYAVQMLSKNGRLAELDYTNIPNAVNIDDDYLGFDFDPDNRYSLPYTWGVLGVLYNKTMVDEEDLGSWDILWNEKYAGEIYMYDSMRDSMAVALGYCGYSINSTDPDEVREAADALIAQKPLVRGWGTDENKDKMIDGYGALAVVFSGDAVWCNEPENGNADLGFFFPEGSNLFFDNFVIPKNAKHKKNAERFINFLLEPGISAKNTEFVGYSTPNYRAFELLPDEWKENPIFNIPKEKLKTLEVQVDLDIATGLYETEWDRVFGR